MTRYVEVLTVTNFAHYKPIMSSCMCHAHRYDLCLEKFYIHIVPGQHIFFFNYKWLVFILFCMHVQHCRLCILKLSHLIGFYLNFSRCELAIFSYVLVCCILLAIFEFMGWKNRKTCTHQLTQCLSTLTLFFWPKVVCIVYRYLTDNCHYLCVTGWFFFVVD